MPKEGTLRVWWIPQVPGDPFYVTVDSVVNAVLVMRTLARYDEFQLEQNIKPDYSNAGGLEVFRGGEWEEWYDDDSGDGIDDFMEKIPETV